MMHKKRNKLAIGNLHLIFFLIVQFYKGFTGLSISSYSSKYFIVIGVVSMTSFYLCQKMI